MCACVRYWPERGVVLNVCFSSEIGLVFFGCRNVLGCLAVMLILQSATKFIQILVVQLFELLVRNILKKTTFSGGVGVGGWAGVNCFVLRSYQFKDNVCTILLPTVGCLAPLPPPPP